MAKPIKISVGCGVGTALHHKLTNERAEKKTQVTTQQNEGKKESKTKVRLIELTTELYVKN